MSNYEIFMSADMSKQWEEAIKDAIWFRNNPPLGPEQKWYYPRGFFRVLAPFRGLNTGDVILIDSLSHSRVVRVASATKKQEFIDYTPELNSGMKLTPHENEFLHPLTYPEIWRLLPHMSVRIKECSGYFAYMKQFPEFLCSDCAKSLNLELRKGWSVGSYRKLCPKCGKQPKITTGRNAFKPIGR